MTRSPGLLAADGLPSIDVPVGLPSWMAWAESWWGMSLLAAVTVSCLVLIWRVEHRRRRDETVTRRTAEDN